ncbi:MAG: NAD(P)/FAD-dependent oxidoreductase [Candidatus Aminicenantes bacterium]|nr:NAD(P)/FAD-dependent oxidoreductase [Candidatus Aminicenantes bacterium]
MPMKKSGRREFIKTALAGIPLLALDWDSFPRGDRLAARSGDDAWDAIIIGAGLGGLSCAAGFARQGFKPLVLEKHSVPGGYATTFKRPGGFVFDVSLHSTTVEERDGLPNLIPGFPEITDIEFVPHKVLYRAIFPDHDIRVPYKDVEGYIKLLVRLFPEEKEGIEGLFQTMKGLVSDLNKYQAAGGKVNMAAFPKDFPYLFKCFNSTWGAIQDSHIKGAKLKGIVSALWGYFGLPPSKLASLYYILPVIGYLQGGGYYPIGKSQKISDALVRFVEEKGGKVMLRAKVQEILIKDHAAYGVRTADGTEHLAKVVVSNANAYDTFHTMMNEKEFLKDYLARMDKFTASLSSFQVFLGLKKDLVREIGITDTEIFCDPGYDVEESYRVALNAEVEKGGFGLTLYDNLYKGYSPEGKNILNIIALQGYDIWKKYEADYFAGKKDAYRAEKERMADILIKKVEEKLLPGLSRAIEVREVGTPLTNLRYTGNYRGAIYGWDQTLDNSEPRRLPHDTPVRNLYLAGAWTRPGGGYGAVMPSGLQCFAQIMAEWDKAK